jgi:membrane protease YdiL (CAAX protease family)
MIEDGHSDRLADASGRRFFLIALAIEAGLGVTAWVAGRLVGPDPLATLSWSWSAAAVGALAALPPLFGLSVMWNSGSSAYRRIRETLETTLLPQLAVLSMWELAVLMTVTGFGEEMLFRGFLQGLLEGALGPLAGLLAASVIFGLAHPVTAAYFAVTALMGVYLGLLWNGTDNLLAPVIAHGLYDFLAIRWMLTRRNDPVR